MATDPDGDSQMASSPESSHGLSEDSHPGTRTPTNKLTNPRPPPFGGSELSPPGSQTQTATLNTQGQMAFNQSLIDSPLATQTTQQVQQQQQQAQQMDAPGAAWMNKRAEEEYQRAMEYVVDHDFNLDEFGDPFDERDVEEKLF
ncbi:hypothetical protein ABZX51_002998 [Aspergillus tubingensis]|nr:hypothetical protein BO79DRAFT_207851 [Aspergillus costaricaensis CBS 115574]XP_025567918.1 hypothetical protein BO88DRAFT_399811 [Aspergillus vadensis CBS 113365]XP_035356549.1 NmrA-like family protein [Aspergillus tubingensis]GAQ33957.1 similar to An01g07080 [Aspergillus niger]PYH74124.1 hypothetical protein BO88DRAFT_399811 [Aspergillus vadensis CBS 113365]RAK91526.1 hypothetical protein BO79DRAFT_207851 [Aspergillus costaricaensis CBS 115574]GFN15745.1 NmrA-like family protein [Aspergi